MSRRKTLEERVCKREGDELILENYLMHIRAELNRLARQVRGLVGLGIEGKKSGAILRREVLDLIEAAKR